MNSAGSTRPRPRRTRPDVRFRAVPGQRLLAAALLLALTFALSACDLRLETPPPSEPTPDALEVSRRAAATDVLAIIDVASATLRTLDDEDASATTLATIIEASEVHLDELGGEYDSGLDPDPSATPPTPTDPSNEPGTEQPESSLDDVVDRLAQAYSRTRGSLESIPDPGLARLMASVATSQLTFARTLAAGAELELPTVVVEGTPRFPTDPPAGVSSSVLTPVILTEDYAGYAYEVLAARLLDAPRVAAAARASVHRERAEAAAQAAQVARTIDDPRRAAYELPDGIRSSAPADSITGDLELNLTESYASLIGLVAEDERVAYFDLLIDSYHSALTWGAEPVTFPGLGEQDGR